MARVHVTPEHSALALCAVLESAWPSAPMYVRCVQAIERLVAGRTVLIIAHRLSTVQAADQIVVLDAGRVAEARHSKMTRVPVFPPPVLPRQT